jgi:hypothetical protein
MLQLQAPPTVDRGQDNPAARTTRRGACAADPVADLSALSGAAGLHPHAHSAPGHGTMIRATRHHSCLVSLPRGSPRHGDPLSPTQFIALVLAQTMTPASLKRLFPTAMLWSVPSGCDG